MRASLSLRAATELAAYRFAARAYGAWLHARLRAGAGAAARTRARERLGLWPRRDQCDRAIWVHAASLGEVRAAASLLAQLRAHWPRHPILLTTHTEAGRGEAERTIADEVRYFPLDLPGILRRVLARRRPALFVAVETEIWPSLFIELARARVPSALVSACVSERSFARYRMAGALIGAALERVDCVCARDAESAARLRELGVVAERLAVVGDLKSDALDDATLANVPDHLGPAAPAKPVLVAISTHEGEERVVLTAFLRVRERYPFARLVLAPRHPTRTREVVTTVRSAGLSYIRWSARRAGSQAWDVLVVDTTGEVVGFLRSAAAAFVGGSLRRGVGGHNLFEPAAFGLPVAVGPFVSGVRAQAEALRRVDGLAVVGDADALAAAWLEWLSDTRKRAAIARRARDVVRAGAGAASRIVSSLAPLLDGGDVSPERRRTIANHAFLA